MRLLIPLNGDDIQESTITSLDSFEKAALIEIDASNQIVDITLHDLIEPLFGSIDYLIVDSPNQDFETFYDHEIEVLLSEPFATIDAIHEAYLFRSLQEIH